MSRPLASSSASGPGTPAGFLPMLKEAGLTAVAVFALSIGLVGFRALDVPGGLQLITRFDDVIAVTLIGFIGRLGLILRRRGQDLTAGLSALVLGALYTGAQLLEAGGMEGPWHVLLLRSPVMNAAISALLFAFALIALSTAVRQRLGIRQVVPDRIAARVSRAGRWVGPALLLFAVALPFLPFTDRRLLDIGILVVTYIMLGWGLNIVVGLAGLLDLGYVAFYAVGAYSYALLATYFDFGFWLCLPFAGIMAAFAGVLLGFPVLRLRGDYLAIVTLGFGEIIRVILLNWYTFTKGPDGISGIPRPTFFGLPMTSTADGPTFHEVFGLEYSPTARIVFLFYLILVLALITNAFTMRIRKLPIGRAWEALREDEIACRSLGINPRNTKLTAFGIGAMFGGFAGSFFATRQGFISPESFTFIESAVILAIVVLGGMGSQIGVVFAAILLIGLPEVFRELQDFRMVAFGGAMVLIMAWRPQGLLAHREPTIRLHGSAGPPATERVRA